MPGSTALVSTPVSKDLTKEIVYDYTPGMFISAKSQTAVNISTLPPKIDSYSWGGRNSIYADMRLDPQISSCLDFLIASVLGGGIVVTPYKNTATLESSPRDFARADLLHNMINRMDSSFTGEFLKTMMLALAYGHKIAEKIYYIKDSQLLLKNIKPKDSKYLWFNVDDYFNVVSFQHVPTQEALPPDKFCWFTWNSEDGNPQGQSELSVVYTSWWFKTQLMPELMKYLTRYGTPSFFGTVPPNASSIYKRNPDGELALDSLGNKIIVDSLATMLEAVENIRNGGCVIAPYGSTLNMLETQGTGVLFRDILNWLDANIARAMLFQTGATEAVSSSRASAGVHQDTLTIRLNSIRNSVLYFINRKIIQPWYDLNFPDERYPTVKLIGADDDQDFLQRASAVAKLTLSGYFTVDQMPEMDKYLGLPLRHTEVMLAPKNLPPPPPKATVASPPVTSKPVTTKGKT